MGELIPVFRPPLAPEIRRAVDACLQSRWWGYGPVCTELEERFRGCRGGWALATSSCTSSLYLAGRLVREAAGDSVIVPAITFMSTPMAFASAGLDVRVADVSPHHLMITPETVEPLICRQTRAVVAVHLYGQRAPVDELRALCDHYKVALIEDCAHRIDLDGPSPRGDFACYSFNAVKEAPAGEGGLLWCSGRFSEVKARSVSNVGMHTDAWMRSRNRIHSTYSFADEPGLKLRLNDLAASLVLCFLEHRNEYLLRRKQVFQQYFESFDDLPCVTPMPPHYEQHSCLMYVLRVPRVARRQIQAFCAEQGVSTSVHYPSVTNHPLFAGHGASCPVASKAEHELLTLPCFPDLKTQEVERVVFAIRQSLAGVLV